MNNILEILNSIQLFERDYLKFKISRHFSEIVLFVEYEYQQYSIH